MYNLYVSLNNKNNYLFGHKSALFISIVTMFFAFFLVLEIIFHTEFTKYLGYIASLLLPIGVVIMMASFYKITQQKFKTFALLALISAIIYAVLCFNTYFIQLLIVPSNPLNLSSELINTLTFKPGSLIFAVDMYGYVFLCLSTLVAGFALTDKKDKILKILCFLHGALALPTATAPIISTIFLSPNEQTNDVGNYVLIFWCLIFIPLALIFGRYFSQAQKNNV